MLFYDLHIFYFMQLGLDALLLNFGITGIEIFEEFLLAKNILTMGVVYLPSGFLGGLYTGKYNKKRMG